MIARVAALAAAVTFVGTFAGWLTGRGPVSPADGDFRAPRPSRPPPDAPLQRWSMPAQGADSPPFPHLPGEPADVSRSIGDVTQGYLVGSRRIPQPHPGLAFLEVQYDRGLVYTSQGMVEILEGAADHVRGRFPDSRVWLGNLGSAGGGDIPYSVSHNSGRDADLAFFLVDEGGDSVVPDDLVALDDRGRATVDGGSVRFDAVRNWRLVEGIVRAAGSRLQWIFVSRPLRRRLLRRARAVDAPGWIRSRARKVLHQPTGSLPHNDHLHLRIYCSRRDRRSGCRDDPPFWSWYRSTGARDRAVSRSLEALGARRPRVRAAAARRLRLLRAESAASALTGRLSDPSPRVRASAARAAGAVEARVGALAEALDGEDHSRVRADLAAALGSAGGRRAVRTLAAALEAPAPIEGPGPVATDARVAVAAALRSTESKEAVSPLIGALDADDVEVRREVARALRYLTNRALLTGWERPGGIEPARAEGRWRRWFDEHRNRSRREWRVAGFEEAGYEVEGLTLEDVWSLCRAVDAAPHLSYNAQRALMSISGRHPDSLAWPRDAASYYWRHHFAERRSEYGLPPVPDDLELSGSEP